MGREREREAIAAALAALRAGSGGVLVVEGEPGIGKSRLLAHVAEKAEGCTVLAARASEYEADLPYALWAEALDRDIAEGRADRHRLHRELRERLEELAADGPVVLCLDDVHWADPGSAEALAALVHRPPSGPVLLALASRTGQAPEVLTRALAAARPVRLAPGVLDEAEARALVGEAAAAFYADSGGNPFYLEQLARGGGSGPSGAGDGQIPAAVTAALMAELGGLPGPARRLLDAARCRRGPVRGGARRRGRRAGRAGRARGAGRPTRQGARPARRRAPPLRVPPSRGAPRGLRGGAGRVAHRGARAGGGRARAPRRGPGQARPPRRAGGGSRRRGGDRGPRRGGRRAAAARARDRGASARGRPAAAARRAAPHRGRDAPRRRPGRRRRRGRVARHAARRAAHRGAGGPPRADRRRRQRGVVDRAYRRGAGGGCTSRSAPCPRSRRPTASGCASRSRSRRS